jgi:hypothetical protein
MTSPPGGAVWTWAGAAILTAVGCGSAATAWWLKADDPQALSAIGLALAVCLPAGLGGWLLARRPPASPAAAVAGGLCGVAVRIMPPLVTLAWLQSAATPLRSAGAATLLLVFYLAMLTADVGLHVALAVNTREPRGPKRVN